jgi:hypothetical protein
MDKTFSGGGRPAKNPLKKVSRPVRALFTQPVVDALEVVMKQSGINISDVLRLAIFNLLKQRGLLDEALYNDPTWEEGREGGLKGKGLV